MIGLLSTGLAPLKRCVDRDGFHGLEEGRYGDVTWRRYAWDLHVVSLERFVVGAVHELESDRRRSRLGFFVSGEGALILLTRAKGEKGLRRPLVCFGKPSSPRPRFRQARRGGPMYSRRDMARAEQSSRR